ncbi:MAG: gamma carbonic anhydrase family protein [Gammaproteobacteria bacterium]|nr:gamma carbonic anhydrase family protein [Gammaproteobacteria bacterium]MBL6819305.1 gamma carbonic anhydrase family protein [Gammaproteobacteria bacterium]MBL6898484.1 gamma carbonic anhydrase family protein [Gammaproteobacteria bacterium]
MIRKFKEFIPSLGNQVFVDEQATVIGDVSLADDVSIWPQSVVRGDINPISIGSRTNIQDGSVVHVTHKSEYSTGHECRIGADVTVGHGCIIHACTIEDMVLIGMGSVLLDGSTIQSNIIIGAKSLVPSGKVLESGYLYIGSPCKKIRPLKNSELKFLKYSAEHYVNTKNEFLKLS